MPLLFLALGWALAGPTLDTYTTAVRLIDRLYLERDTIDEVALLRSAARGLEIDVHWLRVEASGRTVWLRHGNGTPIGKVEVSSMADLPRALGELERLVSVGGDAADLDLQMSVLWGLCDALDRYSRVLADDRLQRFNVRLTGTRVGIGVDVVAELDHLVIEAVHPSGPAAEAGLRPGDVLARIDGRSTLHMPLPEVYRALDGDEGTQVVLQVGRGGDPLGPVVLTRAQVVVPNVTHRVLEGGIGYVSIDHISQRSVENLRLALAALRDAGAVDRGLVLDLRQNTGGSMREAAWLADQFLSEGLLLRTAGRHGGHVQNLEGEMRAVASRADVEVPLAIVVDGRTASGSEILAGALVEHHRAVVVGARTYGKGTVQKSLPVGPGVNLKLTVAEYILANDRRIGPDGIVPDVMVGQVRLDGSGVHFVGWDQDRGAPPWHAIVPGIEERPGWRGQSYNLDVPLELARLAVASAEGPAREQVLEALRMHASNLQRVQEERLKEALAVRGMDWSGAPADLGHIEADVTLTAAVIGGGHMRLRTEVQNLGPGPLYRATVSVSCPSAPWWDGLLVPVGLIRAGSRATGTVVVDVPTGIAARLDEVELVLRAHRRPPLRAGTARLESQGRSIPALRVEARLVDRPGELGPHGDRVKDARLRIHNLNGEPIPGLEVHFGYPRSEHVELLQDSVQTALVPARGVRELSLAMEVAPLAPLGLPLDLVISSSAHDELARWSVTLPTTGDEVAWQAPLVQMRPTGLSAPVGLRQVPVTVTDDRRVDHVVVWANGEKIAWTSGNAQRVFLRPSVTLLPGDNVVMVEAVDDQGLRTRATVSLWGDVPAPSVGTVDAVELDSP